MRALSTLALAAVGACNAGSVAPGDAGIDDAGIDAVVDASTPPDGPAAIVTITATVNSTRFVTREHMLAAGEMQISGEPLAEAMGRDLGATAATMLPTDLYFDVSALGRVVDRSPRVLDRRRVVRVLEAADEQPRVRVGRGHVAASTRRSSTRRRDRRRGDRAPRRAASSTSRRAATRSAASCFPPARSRRTTRAATSTRPARAPRPRTRSAGPASGRPRTCSRASIRRSIRRATSSSLCAISSDDDPGDVGALELRRLRVRRDDAHLRDRATQIDPTITPGADGFSGWKYGLWVLNYLQVMHDSTEAAVADRRRRRPRAASARRATRSSAPTTPARRPRRARSSARATSRAFRRRCSSRDRQPRRGLADAPDDHRRRDAVGVRDASPTRSRYDYSSPLRWFPGRIARRPRPTTAAAFPQPAYALASRRQRRCSISSGSRWATPSSTRSPTRATPTSAARSPRAPYFDGDPFPADDQLADGEATLHDRALAMMRVALVDLDRLHTDPASGVLVDDVTMAGATPTRGHTLSTTSVAYALIGLRTVAALAQLAARAVLEQHARHRDRVDTPLDALPIHVPGRRGADVHRAARADAARARAICCSII